MIQFLMLKLNGEGMHVSHHHLKIWIAVIWRRKDVQIWDLVYKILQNYDPFFYVETAIGWVTCPQPHKFELRIGHEGRVYKIWNSMYKIVQNEYKIMIQFFMLKLHLGGCLSPAPQIWIADGAKREWCTKFGTRCTKLYKISKKLWYIFRSRNPFWGAGDMHL